MPETVVAPLDVLDTEEMPEIETKTEKETEVQETTSRTPILDQFMAAAREKSGVLVGPVEAKTEEEPTGTEETPKTGEKIEVGKQEEAPSPSIDLDSLLKDPKLGPLVQSQLDKRADALEKARADRYRAKADEEAAKKAQDEADARYAMLVQQANSTDLTDEVYAAREELAKLNHIKLLERQWESEKLPQLRETEFAKEIDSRIQGLSQQYIEGYQRIPELKDPNLLAEVHHLGFTSGADWINTLVDKVAEARVQARVAEELAKRDADREKSEGAKIEAAVAQKLAERRAAMPETEVTTQNVEPRASMDYRRRYGTQREYEAAFIAGEITPDQFKILRTMNLPY